MSAHASDSKILGVNNYATLHVGIGREYVNEYSYYLWQTVNIGGDCLPRVKNIIKRVVDTSAMVVYYSPIVLYLYGYVLYDYMTTDIDSSLTK